MANDEDDWEFDLHNTYFPRAKARLSERDLRRRFVGFTGRTFVNDTVVPGFALQVTERGHKSLVFRYRFKGRTDKITFDRGTSVEQARALAAAARAEVLAGRDPNPRRRAQAPAQGMTVREAVSQYLAKHQFRSKSAFVGAMNRHVLPTLGNRPYESIRRQDLAQLRDAISEKAGRHASKYALQCLNVVWTKGYRDHASDSFTWPEVGSPLTAEDRAGNGRSLTKHEIKSIWHATFHLQPNKGAWVRFLFLTGLRRTSAARITRGQIAPDWSQVAIPGSSTKPPYDLILSAPARDLLREHFPEGARWAFEPLSGYGAIKAELDIHTGQ